MAVFIVHSPVLIAELPEKKENQEKKTCKKIQWLSEAKIIICL